MNKEQMEIIVGLLCGMQSAIVHLSNVICLHTGTDKEDLATSFEEAATAIPAEAQNQPLIQLALQQVAAGIRHSGAGEEWGKLMSRLRH